MCQQQQAPGGFATMPTAINRTSPAGSFKVVSVQTKMTKRRVEKKVSFSHTVKVEEIISRKDMTPKEVKATWYDQLDHLSILIEIKDAIDDVVDSLPPVQCWLPWTRRGSASRGAAPARSDICTRGLEHEVDLEARHVRSENKKRFFSVLFHAQRRHGKPLSPKISRLSERHSQQAKDYARKMGEVDARDAASIYTEDMLRGMPLLD